MHGFTQHTTFREFKDMILNDRKYYMNVYRKVKTITTNRYLTSAS